VRGTDTRRERRISLTRSRHFRYLEGHSGPVVRRPRRLLMLMPQVLGDVCVHSDLLPPFGSALLSHGTTGSADIPGKNPKLRSSIKMIFVLGLSLELE
jgi:hypothetical protein